MSSRPASADPAGPDHLQALAAEQKLQALAERLVVFDEDEGEGHDWMCTGMSEGTLASRPTSRKLRAVQTRGRVPVRGLSKVDLPWRKTPKS